MKQTPAYDTANHDLIAMIPPNVGKIIDVGCMHGQIARVYKKVNPNVNYIGIDIDPDYVNVAKQYCDLAFSANIESLEKSDWDKLFPSDCWIFGDCLEHLHDPWKILKKVRGRINSNGCVLVCIPNAQHWSVQWRLLSGIFRYEESGLMDKTHLRWFTKTTMIEMFESTGWNIVQGITRTLPFVPFQEKFLNGIRDLSIVCGLNPDVTVADAQPFQYIFKLTPKIE